MFLFCFASHILLLWQHCPTRCFGNAGDYIPDPLGENLKSLWGESGLKNIKLKLKLKSIVFLINSSAVRMGWNSSTIRATELSTCGIF